MKLKIIQFHDIEHFLIRTIQMLINILRYNNIVGNEDDLDELQYL